MSTAGKKLGIYMALPSPVCDVHAMFEQFVTELVGLIGVDVKPDLREQRISVRDALNARTQLPEVLFDALLKAAVYDPDPSFNRWFVEPAVRAFGRRRVLEMLLRYLETGANQERAGAARAWYWAVRRPRASAAEHEAELAANNDLLVQWQVAVLREFVANDNIDVRRCLLPGLPLRADYYPAELHELVAEAIHIARTHPDEYLRHRVEHQV